MKRKVVVVFTVFLLVVGMAAVPQTQAKSDLTGHYAEKEMRALISKGILAGYGNGIYQPEKPVTRAEFAKLVVETLELHPADVAMFSMAELTDEVFTDVPEDAWYFSYVYAAVKAGIVKGYPSNLFKPDNRISRQEMAVMIDRALDTRGITSRPATLTFKDKQTIGKDYIAAVEKLVSLGVMNGYPDNTFKPLKETPRGQAAIVLDKIIKLISPSKNLEFQVATFSNDGTPLVVKEYETFQQAKTSVTNNQVVLHGDKIAYMKSGVAVANSTIATIYSDKSLKNDRTYVTIGTEFLYEDATLDYVKVKLNNFTGYVKASEVKLIPSSLKQGQSYYEVNNGELYHRVYNPLKNEYSSPIHTGKAPSFMIAGKKYTSWDGITFSLNGKNVGKAYQYFNYLPLHTKTSYTAEQLDQFIKSSKSDSPLIGMGKHFKAAETKYEVNALYLMSHAILESAWGTSKIARDKNNLFGIRATDHHSYENADTFPSFADNIDYMANVYAANGYLNHSDWRFRGAVLGNKTIGMNVKYASDPYWGEKIAGIMYRADKFLGGKDFDKHTLAITNVSNLNVRPSYGTKANEIYTIKQTGIPLIYTEKKTYQGATWYQIRTDDKNNRIGYVYGNGSLGQYIIELPIMK